MSFTSFKYSIKLLRMAMHTKKKFLISYYNFKENEEITDDM